MGVDIEDELEYTVLRDFKGRFFVQVTKTKQ